MDRDRFGRDARVSILVVSSKTPNCEGGDAMKIGRRGVLAAAAATTGGILYSRGLSAMLGGPAHDHMAMPMAQRNAYVDQPVDAFSPEKRKLVSAMTETLIPRTDTPGAIDAQVPKFLELLYDQWMAPPERALFDKGLTDADGRATARHGQKFSDCDPQSQKAVLEKMEEEQSEHGWFAFGGASVSEVQKDIPFLALFKEITVTGFFMSEVGAQQVLRYEMMPGKFDGNTELSSDDSSWASVPLM